MMLQYNYLLTSAKKRKKTQLGKPVKKEQLQASTDQLQACLLFYFFCHFQCGTWGVYVVSIAGALVQGTQVLEVQ